MAIYLITGATSGIGRALCLEAISRGHTVYGVARRENILQELAEKHKDKFVPFVCDVSKKDQVQNVCDSLPQVPDVVIMDAGVGREDKKDRFDVAAHEYTFGVNYFGALYWIEALFDKFAERKSGAFVGISSLAAYRGLPNVAAYSASKGALSNALDSMRVTYRKQGIDFISVHPGFVDTPMTQQNKFYMPFLWSPEKAAGYILDGVEKGRLVISFPFPIRMAFALARSFPARLWRAIAKA